MNGKLTNVLVYHWRAWHGFLISHLVAGYCQLEAQSEILSRYLHTLDWDAATQRRFHQRYTQLVAWLEDSR